MLAALRRRHYSTFQAVNRVDGRRKRLSKWVECEIILLNRENSVFQVHVLNWVHPCQAVNNALSLLPSARVTGRLLRNSQCRMGYCSTALLLSLTLSRGCRSCSAPSKAVGWLQPPPTAALQISLALAALLPPKLPEIHLARRMGSLAVSQLFSLAEQGAPQALGLVALISLAWDWDLGCLSLYLPMWADTGAIFCITHDRADGINEIKILQWSQWHSQKRIQLQFPNAKLCEVLKCSCLFIFQVFVAFDNCSRKSCARPAIYQHLSLAQNIINWKH